MIKLSKDQQKVLGQWLADSRRASGLSQGDIAKHLGHTTNQYISDIERGKARPSIDLFLLLAKMYEIPQIAAVKQVSALYIQRIREELLC